MLFDIEELKVGQTYTNEHVDIIYRVLNTSVKMQSFLDWETGVLYENIQTKEQFCLRLDRFMSKYRIYEEPKAEQSERVDALIVPPAVVLEVEAVSHHAEMIKADIARRIQQAAACGVAIIHNSVDAEEGYRRAYSLCKMALNRSVGFSAHPHGVQELCSSQAYDEALDHVVEKLETALREAIAAEA